MSGLIKIRVQILRTRASLPTAYVVRREGYVLIRVCPSLCPHLGGEYPSQVQPGGGGVPQPGSGGDGGTPARSRWGVPQLGPGGWYPGKGCTPAGGTPSTPQPGQWGGTLAMGTPGTTPLARSVGVPHRGTLMGVPWVPPGQVSGGTPVGVPWQGYPLYPPPGQWGGYSGGGVPQTRSVGGYPEKKYIR